MKYNCLSILFSLIISMGLNAVDISSTGSSLKGQLQRNDGATVIQLLHHPKQEASVNQAVNQNDKQSQEWTNTDAVKVSTLLVAVVGAVIWITRDVQY
jgi:hypothetical protein